MKIAITGANGFIGNHIIPLFLKNNHEVIAITRNIANSKNSIWFNKVEFVELDLKNKFDKNKLMKISKADKLLHLAWDGLPNYNSYNHISNNLIYQYEFLVELVKSGLNDITVTGTCLEYGMSSGMLSENMLTQPITPYGISKDILRSLLFKLQDKHSFNLKWSRLFYMYGKGQSSNSILAQLDLAIENKELYFNMSKGDQVRDYSSIDQIIKILFDLTMNSKINGIFNCCSGKGTKIIDLVTNHIKLRNSSIKLNLGYYPYNNYEPHEFWGDNSKWNELIL